MKNAASAIPVLCLALLLTVPAITSVISIITINCQADNPDDPRYGAIVDGLLIYNAETPPLTANYIDVSWGPDSMNFLRLGADGNVDRRSMDLSSEWVTGTNQVYDLKNIPDATAVDWSSASAQALVVTRTGRVFRFIETAPAGDKYKDIGIDDGNTYSFLAVDWNPTGDEAVMAGNRAVVYAGNAFTVLEHNGSGALGVIKGVAWKPDGTQCLLVSDAGTVLKHEKGSADMTDVGSIPLAKFNAVAWKQDGSEALIVGNGGKAARLAGNNLTELSTGLSGMDLTDIAWDNDGSFAIIIASDGSIIKFDGVTFKNLHNEGVRLNAIDWNRRDDGAIIGANGKLVAMEKTDIVPDTDDGGGGGKKTPGLGMDMVLIAVMAVVIGTGWARRSALRYTEREDER